MSPNRMDRINRASGRSAQARDLLQSAFRGLFRHEQWAVGLIHGCVDPLSFSTNYPDVRWLSAPPGKFWADPFVMEVSGKIYLFVEEWEYARGKGSIVCLELRSSDFAVTSRWTAIRAPFHLSYPQVLRQGGEIFCVPESYQAREVAIYKASRFPDTWIKIKTLIPAAAAVDPTMFVHDGKWWLFCTDACDEPFSKLHLWYSDDLLGTWKPHPSNPVKTDIASARPAGPVIVRSDGIYRPAQDCSATYGGRITMNRIRLLTTERFEEEPVGVIPPDASGPYPFGCHTLCIGRNVTAVDGKRYTFSAEALLQRVQAKLPRIGRFKRLAKVT